MEKSVELLEFKIGNQSLAFDVDAVEMVIEAPETTVVPGAPDFVKGVINLRGRIVTVIDLASILALDIGERPPDQILVLKVDGEELGIPVHGVDEVFTVDISEIGTPVSRSERYLNKVKGIIKRKDRLILYLDVNKILNMDEKEG
ncbi:MAG: purine-binding chemotaxis protein CheW [Thermotogota bacterium]|nr:purine-binding chemotaxis protein CheW [Thermotogota bacterium]MDK2864105.1 purine-binding chemotaxis protein CheW [Thermotogota bacterium]